MFAPNGHRYKPTGMGRGNRRQMPDFQQGLAEMLAELERKSGVKDDDRAAKYLAQIDIPDLHQAQKRMLAESRR